MGRRWIQAGKIFGCWMAVAAVVVGNALIAELGHDHDSSWFHFEQMLRGELLPLGLWALATPWVLRHGRALYERPRAVRLQLTYAAVALSLVTLVGVARAVAHNLLVHGAGERHPWRAWLFERVSSGFYLDLLIYAGVLGVAVAICAAL